jgi:hypothetical protein
MHRSQRTGHGAIADPTGHPSAPSVSRVRMSTLILFITRDRDLSDRLTQSLNFAMTNFSRTSVASWKVQGLSRATWNWN